MDECDNDWPMGQGIEHFVEAWPAFKAWWLSQDTPYGGKFSVEEIPPEPFSAFLATAPVSDAMLAAGAAEVREWFATCSPDSIKVSAHSFAMAIFEAMCRQASE